MGRPATTTSSNRRLNRRSMPEELRESLQERILDGEFEEGETLVQDALAEEYGVSRIPVREALRQLEACGLVSIETHRGAVVSGIPTEQIEELYDLRGFLETDALRRAIPKLTDQDLAEAAAILDELKASYAANDLASWGRLNWAFHRRLYLPSGRVRTIALLDSINLQLERYVRLHLLVTEGLADAEREHRELLQLCFQRDADSAAAHLDRHISEASRSLLRALRHQRAAPITADT